MLKYTLILISFISMYSLINAQTDPNLVFYYPMDGSVSDEIGNLNNETLIGGTPMADRFGNEEGAFYFDGKENSYTADLDEDLCIENGVTISCWIKHESLFGSRTFFTIKNRDSFLYNCYNEIRWQYSHSMHCVGYFSNNGGICIWDTTRSIQESDLWYHVVGSIYLDLETETAESIIYINGERKHSQSISTTKNNLWGLNRIEMSSKDLGTNKGTFDDLRIYNRVLSSCEIESLANDLEPSDCADHNPLSCTPTEKLKTIVYPNPSDGFIRLHEEDRPSEHLIQWQLIDIQGKQVADGTTRCNNDQLDLRSYPSGIYFLKFKDQYQKVVLY